MKNQIGVLLLSFMCAGLQFKGQEVEWTKSLFASEGALKVATMTTDAAENSYIAFRLYDTFDFDQSEDEYVLTGEENDPGIVSYTADGELRWVVVFPQNYDTNPNAIKAIDVGDGVLVLGRATNEMTIADSEGVSTHDGGYNEFGFLIKVDYDGNALWTRFIGGLVVVPTDITVDNDGSIYMSGSGVSPTFMTPDGETITVETQTNVWSFHNAILAKLDSEGKFLWSHTFGAVDGTEVGQQVEVDNENDLYFYMSYNKALNKTADEFIDLDPSSGTSEVLINRCQNHAIIKFDSEGEFIWEQHSEPEGSCLMWDYSNLYPSEMTLDDAGNIYLAGSIHGSVHLSSSQPSLIDGTDSNDNTSCYLMSLDSDGAYRWGHNLSYEDDPDIGTNSSVVSSLEFDNLGRLNTWGLNTGTVDFDWGNGEHIIQSVGYRDVYWLVTNEGGEFMHAEMFGSLDNEQAVDLHISEAGSFYAVFGAPEDFQNEFWNEPIDFEIPDGVPLNHSHMIMKSNVPVHVEEKEVYMTQLFPNPAVSGSVLTMAGSNIGSATEARWYDLAGKLINQESLENSSSNQPFQLAVPELESGSYLVTILLESGDIKTGRIIVM